jgi:hypothetical protein
LYEYGRPARAIFGKQGGGKYSVFVIELRALALAVLAVQVPRVGLKNCKFCSVIVLIASLQRLAMLER